MPDPGILRAEKVKKILLVQLGDIGDVVWTVPTLWALKGAYPDAQLSILVREGIGTLIQEEPSVAKVFEIRKYTGSFLRKGREQIRFLKTLRREKFSAVIDLRADDRGAIMAYLTGAPMRVSWRYREGVPFWRNRVFTHLVDPLSPEKKVRGAAEQSLRIIRALGIEPQDTIPRLRVSEEGNRRAREMLQGEKIADSPGWISVSPFSRWRYKEWGLEKWQEIIDWVWSRYRLGSVIVGASKERERAAALEKAGKGAVFNLAGKTTLRDLLGVLQLSLLHVGVDSAPPHIAAAAGTPTVTLYGPSDWYEWAPIGDRHRVIVPEGECVPCRQKGCEHSGRSRCLEELRVDQVRAVIQPALEQVLSLKGIRLP